MDYEKNHYWYFIDGIPVGGLRQIRTRHSLPGPDVNPNPSYKRSTASHYANPHTCSTCHGNADIPASHEFAGLHGLGSLRGRYQRAGCHRFQAWRHIHQNMAHSKYRNLHLE